MILIGFNSWLLYLLSIWREYILNFYQNFLASCVKKILSFLTLENKIEDIVIVYIGEYLPRLLFKVISFIQNEGMAFIQCA